MLCCAVLCCAVLCCAVLCCACYTSDFGSISFTQSNHLVCAVSNANQQLDGPVRYSTLCEIARQPAKHQHELVHTVVLIILSKSLRATKGSRLAAKQQLTSVTIPTCLSELRNRLLCTGSLNSLGTLKARFYVGKMFLVLFLMHL